MPAVPIWRVTALPLLPFSTSFQRLIPPHLLRELPSGGILRMFEYFTDKAIAVVLAAQEEARRLGHRSAGTEQLLLGLIRIEGTLAATVLANLGVTLKAARIEVEKIMGRLSGGA